MKARSPLHDRTDPQVVLRLVGNMKARSEGQIAKSTLMRDIQELEAEIAFSEQRSQTLKERTAFAGSAGGGVSHHTEAQIFGELLNETEQELLRLYNARQYLQAEKLMGEGASKEAIAAALETGSYESA